MKQICGTCNGTGWDEVERVYRDKDGNVETKVEKIVCKSCGGSGWLNV